MTDKQLKEYARFRATFRGAFKQALVERRNQLFAEESMLKSNKAKIKAIDKQLDLLETANMNAGLECWWDTEFGRSFREVTNMSKTLKDLLRALEVNSYGPPGSVLEVEPLDLFKDQS